MRFYLEGSIKAREKSWCYVTDLIAKVMLIDLALGTFSHLVLITPLSKGVCNALWRPGIQFGEQTKAPGDRSLP